MATPHSHKRAARIAALCLVCVCGALAAVWTAPRVNAAARAWIQTPPVELQTTVLPVALPVEAPPASRAGTAQASAAGAAGVSAAGAAVVDAGMRFDVVGVTCTPPVRRGPVVVLLRTSEDGQVWSRWYEVGLERAAEEGGPERAYTEAIWTGAARFVQVAARRTGDTSPARLQDVRVVTINSTEDADALAALAGVARRAAATVAGLRFTQNAAAMTTKPEIVTRAEWGANESWRSGSPDYARVKMAFVHHTDSGNDYSAAEAPAVMRAIYAYHTRSLHWSDIGYNFLIDRFGVIYEGHYGGMTRGVVGAQVLGFNTGSTGISLIGTFTRDNPSSAMLTSLERLLEWKLDVHHLDPLGTGTLVCRYGQKFGTGQRVTFPVIAGHRDANYTTCPGARAYALLPAVRKVVARTGQPKIYGFVPSRVAISPNGDGVMDKVNIGFTLSQQATWTVEISDAAGRPVKHLSGEGTAVDVVWGGHDDDGNPLPDGMYSLQADAKSADGAARSATAGVRLDTVAPKVDSPAVEPDPFSPNGDGQDDTTTLRYTPSEPVLSRVSVVDADGVVLRRVTGWKSVGASAHTATWDGRVGSGSDLRSAPEGSATLLLEARDAAGNTTSQRRRVVLDRTLKLTGLSLRTFSPNGDGVRDQVVLSFRLTRRADVVARVIRDGSTMRTFTLGSLTAGARSVTWDGTLGGGGAATSGAYSLRVTADGSVGSTSVTAPVTVDLAAPRIIAPLTVRVAAGKAAKVVYTVRDGFSPTVKVRAVVADASGKVLATLSPGWVKRGVPRTCAWKTRRRGVYTMTFHAMDLGGNRLAAPVKTTIKVR